MRTSSRTCSTTGILVLVLLLCVWHETIAVTPDPQTTPFNQWPMIMAHDSATTYLEGGAWHQINQWTKTQSGGSFSALLECGARSFDFRPKLKSDGSLIMHHGPVDVDHPMGDALDEVLQWADTQDINASNLIHLDIWDCEQSDSDQGSCWDKIESLLEGKNLSVVECDDLKSKTVDDIFSLSRVIVTHGCVTANYDEAVTCSGFGGKASNLRALAASKNPRYIDANLRTTNVDMSLYYTCYADSDSKAFPLDRMWSYVDSVSKSGPPDDGSLYSVQILWQESASSVAIGEAHLSSLLEDESRSQLNQLTASRIRSGEIDASKLNLVEINNVCDGGSDILAALREVRAEILERAS